MTPNQLREVKITAEKADVWPEHGEGEADVLLEVHHKEAITEIVWQIILLQIVPEEAKEYVIGVAGLVRQGM